MRMGLEDLRRTLQQKKDATNNASVPSSGPVFNVVPSSNSASKQLQWRESGYVNTSTANRIWGAIKDVIKGPQEEKGTKDASVENRDWLNAFHNLDQIDSYLPAVIKWQYVKGSLEPSDCAWYLEIPMKHVLNCYRQMQDVGLTNSSNIVFRQYKKELVQIAGYAYAECVKRSKSMSSEAVLLYASRDALQKCAEKIMPSKNAVVDDGEKKRSFNPSFIPHALPKWDVIQQMDGVEFEEFCMTVLSGNGFINLRSTPVSGDQGVDILATKKSTGQLYAVQCKRYSKSLGNKPVQEVFYGKSIYKADKAAVMTNSHFTQQAVDGARVVGVELWDEKELKRMICAYEKNVFDGKRFPIRR